MLHGVVGKGLGKSKRKSMVCVRIELSAMLYVRVYDLAAWHR